MCDDGQDVVIDTGLFQHPDPFEDAQESTLALGVIAEMIMIRLITVKADAKQEVPVMQELTEFFRQERRVRLHGPVYLDVVKAVHRGRKPSEPVRTRRGRLTALETDVGGTAVRKFLVDPLCQDIDHVILHDAGRSDFTVFADVSIKTIPASEIAE